MDVGDGADKLGEDPLDLGGFEGAMCKEVIVQLIACVWSDVPAQSGVPRHTGTVFQDQPDQLLGDYDLV